MDMGLGHPSWRYVGPVHGQLCRWSVFPGQSCTVLYVVPGPYLVDLPDTVDSISPIYIITQIDFFFIQVQLLVHVKPKWLLYLCLEQNIEFFK